MIDFSRSEGRVGRAFSVFKGPLVACGVFSAAINALMLTGSLFMLQVYDRVLPSRSVITLQVLLLLVVALYVIQGALEAVRSRVFSRVGRRIDGDLGPDVFSLELSASIEGGAALPLSPLKDLEQLRGFLASGAPSALFDLPWTPFYVVLLFMLHPWIGAVGLVGIFVLSFLTWMMERLTSPRQRSATALTAEAATFASSARHNAEIAGPLGMGATLSALWVGKNALAGAATLATSDVVAMMGAASRFVRVSLQSGVLALGALLVIRGEASGGVMIASSILLGRSLAPVELAIGHWRSFVSARQAYRRLDAALAAQLPQQREVQLPAPTRGISVEGAWAAPPGSKETVLRNITFELQAGDALGVIGPSGSGKSSLARTLVGVWSLQRGAVRYDGATLDQWAESAVGRFVGYLPQGVELFGGSIGWNIARLEPGVESNDVLTAARNAGLEDFIRRLPEGFETPVGRGGERLSAGQRQRVALARALYRDPFFVVLDEPNSALDAEGETALTEAISRVRRRGGIVVVIAHRPSALQAVNKVLRLRDGAQADFGLKEEVLKRILASAPEREAYPAKAGVSL